MLAYIKWNFITNLGLLNVGEEEVRQLKVYNKVLAISLITYFLFIPMTAIIGSIIYFLIILSSCLFLVFCLWLNSIKKFNLSKVLFLSVLIASISLMSLHLGIETGIFLSLIPISSLPLLYLKRKWMTYITFLLSIASFFLIIFYDQSAFALGKIENWKINLLHNTLVAGVLLVGYLYNVYFKISAEEKDDELIQINRQISSRNFEILQNIQVARDIQANLLPFDSHFKNLFPDSFVFYKPRDVVSGDFYWVEKVGDIIYTAVIDCTGHGVPGAFVSILGHQGLNRCIYDLGLMEPADILNKLHELIFHVLRKEDNLILDGMDMSLTAFDLSTRKLTVSGANNSVLLVRKNDINLEGYDAEYRGINCSMYKLQGQRQSVGSEYIREAFVQKVLYLEPSDTLYYYTDGYVDQFGGPSQKKLMHKQFKKLLLAIDELDMSKKHDEIKKYFENWKGSYNQVDDVCVIGLKFKT